MLSGLNPDDLTFVHERAVEIKSLMNRTAANIREIGQKLIQAKERLEHGKFGEWLRTEFDWDERTARNFMAVANTFKSENFADLSLAPSALYLLAAPSTPEEARIEALELAEQGESISHAKAKEIVSRHKADEEDLAKFEAIASKPAEEPTKKLAEKLAEELAEEEPDLETSQAVESPKTVTEKKPKSELVPFQCSMSQQQRERLFEAINKAKNQYALKTTPEALDVIAQEFLNAQ